MGPLGDLGDRPQIGEVFHGGRARIKVIGEEPSGLST
jgi:hypothetical protein